MWVIKNKLSAARYRSIYKKSKQPKRSGGEGNCPRPRVKATSWAFTSENPGSAGANKIEAVLGERLGS